jgi:ATP-dependent DNA ligase
VDGELVAFDQAGVASFARFAAADAGPQPSPALLADVPVVYQVLDLLFLDGRSTTGCRMGSAESCSPVSGLPVTRRGCRRNS